MVAFSPLRRGILTGRFKKSDDFPESYFRKESRKYSREIFPNNLDSVYAIQVFHSSFQSGTIATI